MPMSLRAGHCSHCSTGTAERNSTKHAPDAQLRLPCASHWAKSGRSKPVGHHGLVRRSGFVGSGHYLAMRELHDMAHPCATPGRPSLSLRRTLGQGAGERNPILGARVHALTRARSAKCQSARRASSKTCIPTANSAGANMHEATGRAASRAASHAASAGIDVARRESLCSAGTRYRLPLPTHRRRAPNHFGARTLLHRALPPGPAARPAGLIHHGPRP